MRPKARRSKRYHFATEVLMRQQRISRFLGKEVALVYWREAFRNERGIVARQSIGTEAEKAQSQAGALLRH
jgi:hypothetical protein